MLDKHLFGLPFLEDPRLVGRREGKHDSGLEAHKCSRPPFQPPLKNLFLPNTTSLLFYPNFPITYQHDGRGNRLSIEENGQLREEYQYNIADEISLRVVNGEAEAYYYTYQNSQDYLMVFTKHKPPYTPWTYKLEEEQYFDYREKMVKFHKKEQIGNPWDPEFEDTIDVEFSYLPDGLGRVGKRSYRYLRVELNSHDFILEVTKNIFFLNDFYDLLDEEGEIRRWSRDNPPTVGTYQKVYTMGPGIDFPLIMNYTDTGNAEPYFYFLNGHGDVTYFADANFTPEKVETYEYTHFGLIFKNMLKNNFNFRSFYFDNDIGFYNLNDEIYLPEIGYFF